MLNEKAARAQNNTIYIFDGTFEGLLTAVFEFYEHRPTVATLVSRCHYEPTLLDDVVDVVSDEVRAKRVWAGLCKKLRPDWQQRFYKAFLSETAEGFRHLFDFARYIFDSPPGAEANFGNPAVTAVTRLDKSVNRERHRMKAFIRFQQMEDGVFYAPIEPDFNVLPLISKFFKDRYADQPWIIYDVRRKYGLYYNLHSVEEICFELEPAIISQDSVPDILNEKEALYSMLWKEYFKSTNIEARKNMKLHIRHVPKRYWRFLTEKND